MTSQEYLNQLQKYLKKLPQSDYEDAMEYFTEYFADAGPENEQAPASSGSPFSPCLRLPSEHRF